MRVIRTLVAAGLLATASAASASVIVTDWSYTVASIFTAANFTGGVPITPNVFTPTTLAWGNIDAGHPQQSSLVISDTPASNQANPAVNPGGQLHTAIGHLPTYAAGEIGLTQTFTHNNFTIPIGSSTLDNATVSTTLLLTPFLPASVAGNLPIPFGPLPIAINFEETPNAGPCAPPGGPAGACPDIFVITGGLDNAFCYDSDAPGTPSAEPCAADSVRYFIQIFPVIGGVPTVLNTLSDAQCDAAGAAHGCQGFITPEGASTHQQFAFSITTEPVLQTPEPGMLALFALGLVGLGYTIRRRQA